MIARVPGLDGPIGMGESPSVGHGSGHNGARVAVVALALPMLLAGAVMDTASAAGDRISLCDARVSAQYAHQR